MRIPPGLYDPSGKASESWMSIYAVDGDNETELREYGPKINLEGNNTSCYVLVASGDVLRVKYGLYGGEADFLDLIVDGILRDSLVNPHIKSESKKGYAGAFDFALYQVKNGPRVGALQQWQMVVQHRTEGNEIMINDESSSSSKVSSISIQIYRREKDIADEETNGSSISDTPAAVENPLERTASYVQHRQWSDMSDSLVFSGPLPSFKIGFQNGKKATPKSKEKVTKVYPANKYKLWTTFTFNLRSTSDLTALGFENVPIRIAAPPRSIVEIDDSPSATSTPTKKNASKPSKPIENDDNGEDDLDVESSAEKTIDVPKPKLKSKAKAKAKTADSSQVTAVEKTVIEIAPKNNAKIEQSGRPSKPSNKEAFQLKPGVGVPVKNVADSEQASMKKAMETTISKKNVETVQPGYNVQASAEQTTIFTPIDSLGSKLSRSLTPVLLSLESVPTCRAGQERGSTEEFEDDNHTQMDLDSPFIVETPTHNNMFSLDASPNEVTSNVAPSYHLNFGTGAPIHSISASSTQETIDYQATFSIAEKSELVHEKSTPHEPITPESAQKYPAVRPDNVSAYARHEVPQMSLPPSRKSTEASNDDISVELSILDGHSAILKPHHIGGLPGLLKEPEMPERFYRADTLRNARETSLVSDASTEVADAADVEASVRDSQKLSQEIAAIAAAENAKQRLDDMSTQSTNNTVDPPSHSKTSPILDHTSFRAECDLPDFIPEFSTTKQKLAPKPRTELPSSVSRASDRRSSMTLTSPATITNTQDAVRARLSRLSTDNKHTSTTRNGATTAPAATPTSAGKRKADTISDGGLGGNKSKRSHKSSIAPAKKNTDETTNGSEPKKLIGVEFEKKAKDQMEKSARLVQKRVEAAKSKQAELRAKIEAAEDIQKEKLRIRNLREVAENLERENAETEARLATIYAAQDDD